MNNNKTIPMMKRLLLVWVMVFGLGMPGWGQGMVDYAEFEVVGKMKKPGAVFLLGIRESRHSSGS